MALRDSLPLPTLTWAGMTCTISSYTVITCNYADGLCQCVCAASLMAGGEPVEGLAEVRLVADLLWTVNEYTALPLSRVVLRPVDDGYEIEFSLSLASMEAMLE